MKKPYQARPGVSASTHVRRQDLEVSTSCQDSKQTKSEKTTKQAGDLSQASAMKLEAVGCRARATVFALSAQ